MKKDRLHQIYDIGSLLTIITMLISGVWYFAHQSAKTEFLNEQIKELKVDVASLNSKMDKIYEILITRK